MCSVYVKTTKHGRDVLVAVCDANLIGQTLRGEKVSFVVSERFYKGTSTNIIEAIEAMRKATICNIIGKKIVEEALNQKMIHESAIIFFEDIPHAQIVKL
jgi:hypothetical protein